MAVTLTLTSLAAMLAPVFAYLWLRNRGCTHHHFDTSKDPLDSEIRLIPWWNKPKARFERKETYECIHDGCDETKVFSRSLGTRSEEQIEAYLEESEDPE